MKVGENVPLAITVPFSLLYRSFKTTLFQAALTSHDVAVVLYSPKHCNAGSLND